MATRQQCRLGLLLLLAVLLLVLFVGSGAVGKASAKTAVIAARKEDVKYIKCAVCEEIVKQLHRQVKKKRDNIAPKKLSELEIIELTENICNIKKEESDWLMFLDIVEDGSTLKLVEQLDEGECNSECKTIERACQEVMGEHDTDVAEFLYKGEAQRSALQKYLCKDLSKACVGKPPAVPKDREPGEPFTPKPKKDTDIQKLMRQMGDMPGAPPMSMYTREQLEKQGGLSDDGDDEDWEDDEEDIANIPDIKDLKKELSKKDKAKVSEPGWLDQAQEAVGILKSGVQTAVDSAAQRARKAFGQAKKWWYGTKSSAKRKLKTKSSKTSSGVKSQKTVDSEL